MSHNELLYCVLSVFILGIRFVTSFDELPTDLFPSPSAEVSPAPPYPMEPYFRQKRQAKAVCVYITPIDPNVAAFELCGEAAEEVLNLKSKHTTLSSDEKDWLKYWTTPAPWSPVTYPKKEPQKSKEYAVHLPEQGSKPVGSFGNSIVGPKVTVGGTLGLPSSSFINIFKDPNAGSDGKVIEAVEIAPSKFPPVHWNPTTNGDAELIPPTVLPPPKDDKQPSTIGTHFTPEEGKEMKRLFEEVQYVMGRMKELQPEMYYKFNPTPEPSPLPDVRPYPYPTHSEGSSHYVPHVDKNWDNSALTDWEQQNLNNIKSKQESEMHRRKPYSNHGHYHHGVTGTSGKGSLDTLPSDENGNVILPNGINYYGANGPHIFTPAQQEYN